MSKEEFFGSANKDARDQLKGKGLKVRRFLARHETTPVETLELLSDSKDELTRAELASNPNTPLPILSKLATERNSQLALAWNRSATPDLLEQIASDTNAENLARDRAAGKLSSRSDSRYFGMKAEAVRAVTSSGNLPTDNELEEIKAMPTEWVVKMYGNAN
jgi:hypothetical protein